MSNHKKNLFLLKEKFNEFKNIPFPKSPEDEELSDMFFDLVQFDSYIAGAIDKILIGKIVNKSELKYDSELEKAIKQKIENDNQEENKLVATKYLLYLLKIKELIKIAQDEF